MTKPQSFPILLQLPPRQLESVFEVCCVVFHTILISVSNKEILSALLAIAHPPAYVPLPKSPCPCQSLPAPAQVSLPKSPCPCPSLPAPANVPLPTYGYQHPLPRFPSPPPPAKVNCTSSDFMCYTFYLIC